MEELIEINDQQSEYFLYLITCNYSKTQFIKIGKSKSLESRIKNIQTGCPHKISKVFVISSEFGEEINGIEKYIHYKFKLYKLNGEWYIASADFINAFIAEMERVNSGKITWDEINEIQNEINFDSLEILLHHHEYVFTEVQKAKGKYQKYFSFGFNNFANRLRENF